jgi:hypothetical protein
VALRTYQTLAESGVRTIEDVGRRSWSELVDLLDRGGYVRYDYKTASRLLDLAATVAARFPDGLKALSQMNSGQLQAELDALPGWGPVTVRLFLRELRGVWRGAELPIDPRALGAARDLGWQPPRHIQLAWLARRAYAAGVDVRDLEAALVRSSLRGGRVAAPAKPLRPSGSRSGRRSGPWSGHTARFRRAPDRRA